MGFPIHSYQSNIKDEVHLWNITDTHLGNRETEEELLRETVEEIRKDPKALWIAGGDKCEFIGKHDHRYDTPDLADWLDVVKLDDLFRVQSDYYTDIMRPIAKKCVGSIGGNHERKIRRLYSFDVNRYIADKLSIKYLDDYAAWVELGLGETKFTIFTHHGWGSGTGPSSASNILYKSLTDYDADLILLGHNHGRDRKAQASWSIDDGVAKRKKRVAVMCGSFLVTPAYAARLGYSPLEPGSVEVILKQSTKDIKVVL